MPQAVHELAGLGTAAWALFVDGPAEVKHLPASPGAVAEPRAGCRSRCASWDGCGAVMQDPQGLVWDGTVLIFLAGAGLGLCWKQCRSYRDVAVTAEQGWLRGEVCSAPRPTSGAAGGNKELEGDSGAPLSPRIFQATGDCAQHVKLGKEGRR